MQHIQEKQEKQVLYFWQKYTSIKSCSIIYPNTSIIK